MVGCNFHLVTVATNSQGYFQNFLESCNKHGMPLTVLGWGQRWQGFTWRFTLVMDFLKTLPPGDIVAFVDAYDVICLHPKEVLIDRFKKHRRNIVFISEKTNFQNLVFGKRCKGLDVNGGFYMGYAGALLDMLTKVHRIITLPENRKRPKFKDDQAVWWHVCNNELSEFFNKHVSVDTTGHIMHVPSWTLRSLNHCNVEDLNCKDPVFFHCIGNRNMDKVIKFYGYKPLPEPKSAKIFERTKYYVMLALDTHWCRIVYILCVCIVCLVLGSLRKKNIS